MNIAICDDEKVICETLTTLVVPHTTTIFHTPSSLYTSMEQGANFDVIFMDLDFSHPDEDGILWAKKIHDRFPQSLLIILTAYTQRYKEGYVARAFRFMTKPIDPQELDENLTAAMNHFNREQNIFVTANGHTKKVPASEILYLSAQSGGSDIHTQQHTHYHEESLLYWENTLSSSIFFRIHKKYLINLSHIQGASNHTVLLTNGEILPVSRRKWTAFRLAFMKYDVGNHVP